MKKVIDVRGLPCPKPVIEVKKAIESSTGDFKVITNSAESKENILRFLSSQKIAADVEKIEAEFIITFKVDNTIQKYEEGDSLQCGCVEKTHGKSMVISKKRLGEGDEKLGEILIRSFFQALVELETKPSKLFFVNSGVYLTVADSPVLDELKKLYNAGVNIYSCGTCLDYYKIKEKLSVGEVGNMYLLLEILTEDGVFI